MKLLLDTHTFLWWESCREKLSPRALQYLVDPKNQLALSVGSIWEIQIKAQAKKLELTRSLRELIMRQVSRNALQIIPIELPHILALPELPSYHKDPFDRIMLAQAIVEGCAIVSKDDTLKQYASVQVLW